jgi:hypothetical protein
VLNGYEGNIIQFFDENNGNVLLVGNPNTKTLTTTNNGLTWSLGGNTEFIYPNHGLDLSVNKSPKPVIPNPPLNITTISPLVLNFSYAGGQFNISLSNSIITPLTIYATALGTQSFINCGPFEENDDLVAYVLNAGQTNVSVGGNNALSCFVKKWKFTSEININGLLVNDGDVITIGSDHIKVNFNSSACILYPC